MHRNNSNHALVPACRVFFDEFLKSDLFVQEHGMRVLVTPTGARCTRLYGVGELKGVEARGKIFRVTVNDSTASLYIYTNKEVELGTIGQANAAEKGSFIAFIGNVHLLEGAKKRQRAFILAEDLGAVEERVRNSWILATAWRTLERIERLRINLSSGKGALPKNQENVLLDQDRLKEALEHYALDDDKLDTLASTAINAVKSLWQQYRETTREMIGELLKKAGKSGMEREKIASALKTKGLPGAWIDDVIGELIMEGRCYESATGVLTC